MMNVTGLWAKYGNELQDDPLLVLALTAALMALATTPIAFAVLGRMEWFKARRGRVMQRPEFASIVVGMILVMAIPAIFSALVLKSRYFDKNRYEFDPNKTWSVLEQGRGFAERQGGRRRRPSARWSGWRWSGRTWSTTSRSWMRRCSRCGGGRNVARGGADVSRRLAVAGRRPQERRASTARSSSWTSPRRRPICKTPSRRIAVPPSHGRHRPLGRRCRPRSKAAPSAGPGNGLSPAQVEAELAAVPEPQQTIAAMLPLSRLAAGLDRRQVGRAAHRDLQRRQPLSRRSTAAPRASSSTGSRGWRTPFTTPPATRPTSCSSTSSRWPMRSRPWASTARRSPMRPRPLPSAIEGYTSAGSTLFYAGKYYTQIVSTQDDPKFAAFALELARRVAAKQKPGGSRRRHRPSLRQPSRPRCRPAEPPNPDRRPRRRHPRSGQAPRPRSHPRPSSPFCRPRASEGDHKYVAQDVFGYSFLSDVFMADYKDGDVTWQGFLRPYRDAKEAKAVFEKYLAGVKQDGAEVKTIDGRRGRRDGHQHQHRPGRRRFPQGQHPGRRQRRHRPQAGRGICPRRWPRALPANVPSARQRK